MTTEMNIQPDAKRRTSARRHSSLRTASSVAAAVNETTQPKDMTHYVKITKAALEFKMMCLQAEMKLLEELAKMSDDEKLDTLFFLLDKDRDGAVNTAELADGLRKVRGDVNFEESLALAMDRVATFDKDGDAKLNLQEFQTLVNTLTEAMGCNFHELSEMLVMQVVFAEGNNAVESLIASVAEEEISQVAACVGGRRRNFAGREGEIRKLFVDTRMRALFDLFDVDHDGEIDFKEIVLGMYKILEDIDGASHAAVNALIMLDQDDIRTLSYEKFCRFIINVSIFVWDSYFG
jgi:Ca2+-binding EF-hand superfamily protein